MEDDPNKMPWNLSTVSNPAGPWNFVSGPASRFRDALSERGPNTMYYPYVERELAPFESYRPSEGYYDSFRAANRASVDYLKDLEKEAAQRAKTLSRSALLRMLPNTAISLLTGAQVDNTDAMQVQAFAQDAMRRMQEIQAQRGHTETVGAAQAEGQIAQDKEQLNRQDFTREQQHKQAELDVDAQNRGAAAQAESQAAAAGLEHARWLKQIDLREQELRAADRAQLARAAKAFNGARGALLAPISRIRMSIEQLLAHGEEDIKDFKGLPAPLLAALTGRENLDDATMEQVGNMMIEQLDKRADEMERAVGEAAKALAGEGYSAEEIVELTRQSESLANDLRHAGAEIASEGFSRKSLQRFTDRIAQYDNMLGGVLGIDESLIPQLTSDSSLQDTRDVAGQVFGIGVTGTDGGAKVGGEDGSEKPKEVQQSGYLDTGISVADAKNVKEVENKYQAALDRWEKSNGSESPRMIVDGKEYEGYAAINRAVRLAKEEKEKEASVAAIRLGNSTESIKNAALAIEKQLREDGVEFDDSMIKIKPSEGNARLGPGRKVVISTPHKGIFSEITVRDPGLGIADMHLSTMKDYLRTRY